MSFRSLYINFVTFLRNNVADPLSRGTDWIFFNFPSEEIDYPIVVVSSSPGGGRAEIEIGDGGSRFSPVCNVEIYTDSNAVATVNSDQFLGNELLTYLADQIITALINNRLYFFNNYNIIDVFPTTPPRIFPYDETVDQYRCLISVMFQLEQAKT